MCDINENIMEYLFIVIITVIAMLLFSTAVMLIYAVLETDHKKKEIQRYVRREIMKQIEQEKNLKDKMQETVDLSEEYR
jgi:hypothetical protein